MNRTRTTDLETVAMGAAEQALATQLAEAAERMPLNPEALAEVRGRAGSRRRVPVRLLVAGAAAVLAVVALVGSIGHDAPPVELESASGSSAPASASNPDDGVLLVFDYPNSDEPDLAGEWTTLNTLTGSYHWRGGPDSLPRSEVNDEESRMAQFLDIIDATGSAPADEVIGDVVAAAAGAPLAELGSEASQWDDTDRHQYEFGTLARIIESGLATPSQIARVLQLLQSVPDVEVQTFDAGIVRVTFTPVGGYLTIDTDRNRPVASSYSGDETTTKRYLSVTPAVSEEVLAGSPPADLSTTSTTEPPTAGDEPR